MKINLKGQVLGIHKGVGKKSGKPYTVADVYDGEDLLKVFNAPADLTPGKMVEIPCRLSINENGGCFIMAINK